MKLNHFSFFGGGEGSFGISLGIGRGSSKLIEIRPKWGECPHFSINMA